MKFPVDYVKSLIFGGTEGRRFTQDSPILPDVWAAYAERPLEPRDLLLTPHVRASAGVVGKVLRQRLGEERKKHGDRPNDPRVAYTGYSVVAEVYLDELVRVILPMTCWWRSLRVEDREAYVTFLDRKSERQRLADLMRLTFRRAEVKGLADELSEPDAARVEQALDLAVGDRIDAIEVPKELLWMAQIVGALLWSFRHVSSQKAAADSTDAAESTDADESTLDDGIWSDAVDDAGQRLLRPPRPEEIVDELKSTASFWRSRAGGDWLRDDRRTGDDTIWQVNRNRPAKTAAKPTDPVVGATLPNVMAIKADAARKLFGISCRKITWAIVDTGVDASHPAFLDPAPPASARPAPDDEPENPWWRRTRVRATFDFLRIRDLLNPNAIEETNASLPIWLRDMLRDDPEMKAELKELKASLEKGRQIHWGLLERFLKVPYDDEASAARYVKYKIPRDGHGTHVAGIVGGCGEEFEGVCPDIQLYDLRVLGQGGSDDFTIMAALQFIDWLNSHRDLLVVHGANLSLQIRHKVESFACGATPICEEAERLMASGVVVVAAAGNEGYHELKTETGSIGGYLTLSITDPGNAEKVVTVGATHRSSPHTYGVSYFSSRGPTGDGRTKPDLVAPGEKITSAEPGGKQGRRDGTSQAAPHVSGAAALLMARHSELIGKSLHIKDILCSTATDLGRERYFQGHGMVDALRALQSV